MNRCQSYVTHGSKNAQWAETGESFFWRSYELPSHQVMGQGGL